MLGLLLVRVVTTRPPWARPLMDLLLQSHSIDRNDATLSTAPPLRRCMMHSLHLTVIRILLSQC